MRIWLLALFVSSVLSGCTSSYPYLITTDNCNCERFVFSGEQGRFELEVTARYVVDDRIHSEIELIFRNRSRDSLSLRQAYIKGNSMNIRYQSNDRFQPMPFVAVFPGGSYRMTFEGSDTQESENPWLKIAGEKVTLEIQGVLLGLKTIPPIVLTLVPYNPKLYP